MKAPLLVGAVLAGVALLVVVRTLGHVRAMLHPPRAHVGDVLREGAAKVLPGLRDVQVRTGDGLRLSGWFAPGTRRDAVVFVHGLGNNRTGLEPEAVMLSRCGHGVLLYDSRASGESEGALATWGDQEERDVRGAVDAALSQPEVAPGRIGLFGFSVGSTAAALEAAADKRVAAVVLGPVWHTLDDELHDKFHRLGRLSGALAVLSFRVFGVDVGRVRPVDSVLRIPPRPLFFVVGSEDSDTPPAIMRQMQAQVPKAELWIVPGASHGGYEGFAAAPLADKLCSFFGAALP